jgi:sporulation protein YlmC with PRC-barrel domain
VDIPLNTDVICADQPCGQSTNVILNPVTERVTHLVVREKTFPHTEYLVPIDLVIESTPHVIRLRCTSDVLKRLELFVETEFVATDSYPVPDDYVLWPYSIPDAFEMPVEHERIPPGELAVRRGARVRATDGQVGRVDGFLVDPTSGHITHLVLREGHPWDQRDVTIPVSEIDRIEDDAVILKLDKHSIGTLPAIPVKRYWQQANEIR